MAAEDHGLAEDHDWGIGGKGSKMAEDVGEQDKDGQETAQEEQIRVRQTLYAAIAVLLIMGAGWYLITELNRSAKLQACMEQGRRNCVEPQYMLGGPRH